MTPMVFRVGEGMKGFAMPSSFLNQHPSDSPVMDDRLKDWQPATISDQKLFELAQRLARVQRMGGTFAGVGFSAQAKDRLCELRSTRRRNNVKGLTSHAA
ncbi:MAG: hypothetical protein WC058_10440 [Phycisphaeraceae bacterium]